MSTSTCLSVFEREKIYYMYTAWWVHVIFVTFVVDLAVMKIPPKSEYMMDVTKNMASISKQE